MPKYTCSLACGYSDVLETGSPRNAARSFIDYAWRGRAVSHEDEYRVTVTDEHGGRWVYDVHVEGVELALSVMRVDEER